MKKIEKVSIANISFTLDNDAYVSLKQYLDSLHKYYEDDPDGGEIISDIEARIAELILEEQVYTRVVTKQLIDSVTAQLGTPEELREMSEDDGRPYGAESSIPRRLYRSQQGRVLGGVCSGMAQFWDVNVAWLRLAFLSPAILFVLSIPWHFGRDFFLGFFWVFIVIYLVLWFAIPMATSPRQKLEMRGEKITPSSIRQNLQEGAKTPGAKKAASVLAEVLAVFGRIILFIIKLIVAIVGFSLLVAAGAVLVAMLVVLINPASVAGLMALPLAGLTILSPILLTALVLFCLMVPLLVAGAALLNLVFNWKTGRVFYGILLGVWLLAMIFLSIVVIGNARYLRDEIRKEHLWEWFDDDKWERREVRSAVEELKERIDEGYGEFDLKVSRDSLVVILKKSADSKSNNDTLQIERIERNDGKKKEARIVIRKSADD